MDCFAQKEDRVPIRYLSNKTVTKKDIIEEVNTAMDNMSFKNLQILTLVAGELANPALMSLVDIERKMPYPRQ